MRPTRLCKLRPALCGALLLVFAASALQAFWVKAALPIDSSQVLAPKEDDRGLKSFEQQHQGVVVRKAAAPEFGSGCKRPPEAIELRAIPPPPERGDSFAGPRLPADLRFDLPGTPRSHLDPPV